MSKSFPESDRFVSSGMATPTDAAPFPVIERAGFRLLLHPSGAVYLPDSRTWLVADIHFGKAVSFRTLGVPVPHGTTAGNLQRLSALLAARPSDRIIFLGDFLHSARAHAAATLAGLADWRAAHPGLQLILVRGNHDDRAGDPPASMDMQVVDEPFFLDSARGRLALCHHPQQIEGAYVLSGHWHPCITVGGRAHDRLRLPCFWFGPDRVSTQRHGFVPGKACGILPAFGVFTGMHPIDRRPDDHVYAIAGDSVRCLPSSRPDQG